VNKIDQLERPSQYRGPLPTSAHGEQAATPVGKTVVLRSEATEAQKQVGALRRSGPLPHNEEKMLLHLKQTPRSTRRPFVRWLLFALLPLALICGRYWYSRRPNHVNRQMAYVETDKVGISTDVSGIVQDVECQREPSRFCRTGALPARSPPVPDCPR